MVVTVFMFAIMSCYVAQPIKQIAFITVPFPILGRRGDAYRKKTALISQLTV